MAIYPYGGVFAQTTNRLHLIESRCTSLNIITNIPLQANIMYFEQNSDVEN